LYVIGLSTVLMFGCGPMLSSGIYMSAVPQHRCTIPALDSGAYNISDEQIYELSIPLNNDGTEYSSCQRYAYNFTACQDNSDLYNCLLLQGNHSDIGVINCDNGYFYEQDVFLETPVSQYDLVCDNVSLDSLANTLFFLGFFIGSLFVGPLTDWFGRVVAMQVVCLGLAITGTITAFMPNYAGYVIMRTLTAAFDINCFITIYTYVNEMTSTELRTYAVLYLNINCAVSHVLLPWFCYALLDWRYIHILFSLLPLPFLLVSLFIPESPRWLATKGKYDKLRKVLTKYAESNGASLNDETWCQIKDQLQADKKAAEASATKKKVAVWDLFKRPLMRIMSFNTMFMWFTVAMVYYGLTLNGGKLSGDFYINNTLNSVVEIIGDTSILFTFLIGRKKLFAIGLLGAGTLCIASMLTNLFANGDQALITASTVLVISGKAFGSLCFALVYVVTVEIFPTEARATAISMGSMAARVGSMLSPFILQVNNSLPWFTQTVFGSLSIIAGFLTFLFPETNNVEFQSSLDESEEFYRNNVPLFRKRGNVNEAFDNESMKDLHQNERKKDTSIMTKL